MHSFPVDKTTGVVPMHAHWNWYSIGRYDSKFNIPRLFKLTVVRPYRSRGSAGVIVKDEKGREYRLRLADLLRLINATGKTFEGYWEFAKNGNAIFITPVETEVGL